MKIELHHRHGPHAGRAQRHVDVPVVERRSVQVGGGQEHRGASACELKEFLHPFILATERGKNSGFVIEVLNLNSPIEGQAPHASHFRPIAQKASFPRSGQVDVVSLVPRLSVAGRPIAILGRVRAVIVPSLNAASGRSVAHVGRKILKFLPSVANENATASIVFVPSASLAHVGPNPVNRRFGNTVGDASGNNLIPPASARYTLAVRKIPGGYDAFGAALAAAQPSRRRLRAGGGRYHLPSAVNSANNILFGWHGWSVTHG